MGGCAAGAADAGCGVMQRVSEVPGRPVEAAYDVPFEHVRAAKARSNAHEQAAFGISRGAPSLKGTSDSLFC